MMATLNINCTVRCTKSDDLKKPFLGKIVDVTDDYVIVNILDNDPSERYTAYDIDYTTHVNSCDIVPIRIKHINNLNQ